MRRTRPVRLVLRLPGVLRMKRILIVENDPDVIELIGGQLGREEFAQDVYKPKELTSFRSG